MARAHTAAAAILVAGIVLVPLGFWLYARAAGVDQGTQVAHAKRLLTEVASPVVGSRSLGLNVYERRKWDGEGLVPIAGYTVETAYRLPRRMRPGRIVEHYRRRLADWKTTEDTPDAVTFVRDGDRISLDIVEYRDSATTTRSYGVIVSQ